MFPSLRLSIEPLWSEPNAPKSITWGPWLQGVTGAAQAQSAPPQSITVISHRKPRDLGPFEALVTSRRTEKQQRGLCHAPQG